MHASSVLHWGWSHQRTQGLGAAIHDFFRLGCGRGLSAVLALLAVEGLMHLGAGLLLLAAAGRGLLRVAQDGAGQRAEPHLRQAPALPGGCSHGLWRQHPGLHCDPAGILADSEGIFRRVPASLGRNPSRAVQIAARDCKLLA